ncbi:MAG: translational activator for mitochondrial COX1 [Bathelium mastoideum]|nr:MAG: translational activator for mitochondrial COX1 [Bathelium mastoideum]
MRSLRKLDAICEQCLASMRKSSWQASRRRTLSCSQSPSISRHNARLFSSNTRISFPQTRNASSLSSEQRQPIEEPPQVASPPGLEYSDSPSGSNRLLLQPDNLFHSFTRSPLPDIRRRAAFIKQHAFCPHPSHSKTRQPINPDDPESRKPTSGGQPPAHVRFECPDCGIPVACSEEHWADDYEAHLEICDTLREINEDDHDLRSGRVFTEFEYPGGQMDEAMVNMTNWDTFLYTRDFRAINDPRSMRQVTRMLTYPTTIASVIHELSPYNIRSGALRYTLHPPRSGAGIGIKDLRLRPPPVRIFVLGARAESSLPRDVWLQLAYMFGRSSFHLILVGPEAMLGRDAEFPLPPRTATNPFGAIVEDRVGPNMKISTYVEYWHTLHRANVFQPFDPYFDAFVLFHPGLGHPASSHEWAETLPLLLETKVPIIATGYTEWDMRRDWKWVEAQMGGEVDLLLEPGENRFRSLRWDLNDFDPQDVSSGNWGVFAFRGKRYEAEAKYT